MRYYPAFGVQSARNAFFSRVLDAERHLLPLFYLTMLGLARHIKAMTRRSLRVPNRILTYV